MSSLAYGHLTSRRELTSTGVEQPRRALSRWLDVVAAIVPAEALAIQVVVVDLATTTSRDINGNVVTAISNPGVLRIAFGVLFVLSGVLYAASHLLQSRPWHGLDWIRSLLPPFAFLAWTLAMKASVIDAVAPDITDTIRNLVAFGLGVILIILALLLAGPAGSRLSLKAMRVPRGRQVNARS